VKRRTEGCETSTATPVTSIGLFAPGVKGTSRGPGAGTITPDPVS
jgi:hypothetical protein